MNHGGEAGRGKKPPTNAEAHDPRQFGIRRNIFFSYYMVAQDFNLQYKYGVQLFEYTFPRYTDTITPTMTETAPFPHSPPSRNQAPAPLRISKANCTVFRPLELESWSWRPMSDGPTQLLAPAPNVPLGSVNLIPMAPNQRGMACCCGPIITHATSYLCR